MSINLRGCVFSFQFNWNFRALIIPEDSINCMESATVALVGQARIFAYLFLLFNSELVGGVAEPSGAPAYAPVNYLSIPIQFMKEFYYHYPTKQRWKYYFLRKVLYKFLIYHNSANIKNEILNDKLMRVGNLIFNLKKAKRY